MQLIIIKNLNSNEVNIICSKKGNAVKSIENWQSKNNNASILWKVVESNCMVDAIKESKEETGL